MIHSKSPEFFSFAILLMKPAEFEPRDPGKTNKNSHSNKYYDDMFPSWRLRTQSGCFFLFHRYDITNGIPEAYSQGAMIWNPGAASLSYFFSSD
jgi:hypothetical protein